MNKKEEKKRKKEKKQQKKADTHTQISQARLYDHGSYNELRAFFTVLQLQIALDYIFSRFDTHY